MFSELFITEKNDGQNYENKTHLIVVFLKKKIIKQTIKGVVEQYGCQGDPILFMLQLLPDSLVLTPLSHGERHEMNKRGRKTGL